MKYKVRGSPQEEYQWVEAADPTEASAKYKAGDFIQPKGVIDDTLEQGSVGLLEGGTNLVQSAIPGALEKAGEFAAPYLGGVNPYNINSMIGAVTGDIPEATTTPGKIARATAEVAPGVALNPGSIPMKAAETLTGGLGSFAGEEIGGPWGKLLDTIAGLATPKGIKYVKNRSNTVTLSNLRDAGLTGDKAKALYHDRGLLPADLTERGAGLLEAAIKKSTDPETARLPFTKRPVRDQASLDVAREITPGVQKISDLKDTADATFNMFRQKPNIPHNKQLTRTLAIPDVAAVVKKVKGGMTPNEQRLAINKTNISPAFLERVRGNLSGKAQASTNPAEARHLRRLANTLVASAKDRDWSAAVKLAQRDIVTRRAETNIGSVLNPKMSDADLIKALTEATGRKPSDDLIRNIRDMQKVARTNEAAGGERTMSVDVPGHPGGKIAGGAVLTASGHPYLGTASIWSGVKEIAKSATGGSTRKTSDKLVKALSDPYDPIWDYKPPSVRPGAPGLLSALSGAMNRGMK
jgi:hypothetical protein